MKRAKRRYIALGIDANATPSSKELMDAIWTTITKLYGEYGASLTNLTLIDYNPEKRVAVIRTSRAAVNIVRTALTLITTIADNEVAVHVLTVSGTIKALYKKLKQ